MNWVIGIAVLLVVGYLLDREIYFYEGVHLGPRVQAWLYDRWARKYDEGKRESQLEDANMLARPLLDALKDIPQPFILDFATGTGRLSYALMSQPEFVGHIIALDLSQGMLEQAVRKLSGLGAESADKVEFLRYPSLPLPFPDAAFDAVCALEVLELFPNMDEPLAEFARVLRPGGILLASRGTEASGRKAKVMSVPMFTSLLARRGFEGVQITAWWKFFDRVFAVKSGSSFPVGRSELQAVLRCPDCGQTRWGKADTALGCEACGRELAITKEGIVLG